jgi:hypothetical protein
VDANLFFKTVRCWSSACSSTSFLWFPSGTTANKSITPASYPRFNRLNEICRSSPSEVMSQYSIEQTRNQQHQQNNDDRGSDRHPSLRVEIEARGL